MKKKCFCVQVQCVLYCIERNIVRITLTRNTGQWVRVPWRVHRIPEWAARRFRRRTRCRTRATRPRAGPRVRLSTPRRWTSETRPAWTTLAGAARANTPPQCAEAAVESNENLLLAYDCSSNIKGLDYLLTVFNTDSIIALTILVWKSVRYI